MVNTPKDDETPETPEAEIEDAEIIEEPSVDEETPEVEAEVETVEEETPAEPADEGTEEATPEAPRRSGGGFVGMLLGGVIAGGIGFGAAQYVSGGWPFASAEDPVQVALDGISADVSANKKALATLTGSTALDDLGASLRADVVATQTRLEELRASVEALAERVDGLEKMPIGDSALAAQTAAAAYERELTEIREMLEREMEALKSEQESAQTLEVNAAEAARAAAARAAMSRVLAAMESGQPFDDALFDLSQSSDAELPAALSDVAAEGVPTLGALQASFPEAAREALDASIRAMVEAGEIGRGEAFLRTQLGTRSLEPKEGGDPDAVLSRAEAALKAGDLATALSELEGMPEAADAALAPWISRAETRKNAVEGADALAATVNQ